MEETVDIAALLRGDTQAWKPVLRDIERVCHKSCNRLSPSERDEVRGAVTMALLRNDMKALRSIADSARLCGYLRAIARRAIWRVVRRHRARRPVLEATLRSARRPAFLDGLPARSADTSGLAEPTHEQVRAILAGMMHGLTALQGEVMWRRCTASWTWRDIANSLGKTRNATLRLHERGLAALARMVDARGDQSKPVLRSAQTQLGYSSCIPA